MTPKLSQDLVDALNSSGTGELEVVSPTGNRRFFVDDEEIHRQAMEALRRQQDHTAIANGSAQMEAGEGTPLDEAFDGIRASLSLPQRQQLVIA